MNTKERLIGLLKYVEELARLPEKSVYSVRSYRSLLYFLTFRTPWRKLIWTK
jgi:hypothetical protein